MNEGQRAEVIARAIDALLGGAKDEVPNNADHELRGLLNVARERLRGSLFIAKASLQHEQSVWQNISRRLTERGVLSTNDAEPTSDNDAEELAEVIELRRKVANEALSMAEAHRGAVWEKVQSRLSESPRYRPITGSGRPFRRRSDPSADTEPRAGPNWQSSTIPPPHPRLAIGQMAESAQEMARARVWARIASSMSADELESEVASAPSVRGKFQGFALAAAAVAVVAVALGPLPATGLAGHPAGILAKNVRDYVGATEGDAPSLSRAPGPTRVGGRDMTVGEASDLLTTQISSPATIPAGFELAASKFFEPAIFGGREGTFMLSYASGDARITIYQEAGRGGELVADHGAATAVTLQDGTAATLVRGTWAMSDGDLTWSFADSETLIFERRGVSTIIEVQSELPRTSLLFEIAQSMR
jgi:hypothetical protein